MKKAYLAALLICLPITSTHTAQLTQNQSNLIKKLKKAWQSNWVKVGTISATSGTLYALYTMHRDNQKLFWGLTSAASALACIACIYTYLTEGNNQNAQNNTTPAQKQSTLNLNDDFFDFEDDDIVPLTNIIAQETTAKNASEEEQQPLTQITETAVMGDSELPEAVTAESLDNTTI